MQPQSLFFSRQGTALAVPKWDKNDRGFSP